LITKRIDKITRITPAYRCATPPVPKSVKIELTARCDFMCFFCATGFKLRHKADMDWDLLCRLLKELREAGVEEIGMFYLGESFIYKRLPDAIAYARELGFPYIFLTTNGRLAEPPRVRACIEAGLHSLKFSFNWADPEQCKEITRVDAFDAVVQNIKGARRVRDEVEAETGHRCGLFASSIQYDGTQLDRMAKATELIKPYVDEHYWLPLYGQAGLTAGARGTTPVAGNIGRVGAPRDPLPCWAVFTEGHITYDGLLSACCFDHDGRFTMGDLKETSFTEAWHSPAFRELREANLRKDVSGTACEKCIAYG
jgi:MoaA/NifB/PqqE/SkfB family radical SAM enzyme